mgnify:CR=1 FL=1
MAEARIGYRGNAVGISAGLGIALPLAAYAVSLPFDGVSEVVRADAMPFAAGIVAGVGMLALTGHLLDVHADRVAAEEAEAARFSSMYETGVINRGASNSHSQTSSAPRGKRFARKGTPAGVPVISRAVDALDEMEAWAEIDAMFKDGSPISCRPHAFEGYVPDRARGVASFRARCSGRHPRHRGRCHRCHRCHRCRSSHDPPSLKLPMRVGRSSMISIWTKPMRATRPWPPCTVPRSSLAPMRPCFPPCPRPSSNRRSPCERPRLLAPLNKYGRRRLRASRLPTTPAMRVCGRRRLPSSLTRAYLL